MLFITDNNYVYVADYMYFIDNRYIIDNCCVIDIRNVIDNCFDVDIFSFACWKFFTLLYLILILHKFLAVHGQTSSHRKRGPIHSEAK